MFQFFDPVHSDFSLAWSMVPARLITLDEVHRALDSIQVCARLAERVAWTPSAVKLPLLPSLCSTMQVAPVIHSRLSMQLQFSVAPSRSPCSKAKPSETPPRFLMEKLFIIRAGALTWNHSVYCVMLQEMVDRWKVLHFCRSLVNSLCCPMRCLHPR